MAVRTHTFICRGHRAISRRLVNLQRACPTPNALSMHLFYLLPAMTHLFAIVNTARYVERYVENDSHLDDYDPCRVRLAMPAINDDRLRRLFQRVQYTINCGFNLQRNERITINFNRYHLLQISPLSTTAVQRGLLRTQFQCH